MHRDGIMENEIEEKNSPCIRLMSDHDDSLGLRFIIYFCTIWENTFADIM